MASSGPPANNPPPYAAWDSALNRRNPDNTMLHLQMTAYAATPEGRNDVEVWWRLSAVCLNHTYLMDMDRSRVWSQQALQHARRAVQLDPNHFQANLRLLMALGNEGMYTCLENLDPDPPHLEAAFAGVPPFVEQLNRCIALQPDHWLVLLLEGALHMYLWHAPTFSEMGEANAHRLPANFHRLDLETVVHKLRQAYEHRPENTMDWFLADTYYFLALWDAERALEAIVVAERFLACGPFNYVEQKVATSMQQAMSLYSSMTLFA